MIIDLPDTSTATVIRRLYEVRESGGAVTLGRVLTLVVGVDDGWSTEESIEAANEASREHPCRVIVVTQGPRDPREDSAGVSRLDAQIRVGADAGASEVILLHLTGPLAQHSDSVVLPFLLPDTPVVTWWPGTGPDQPADAPLGRLAKRRITGPTRGDPREILRRRQSGYSAGDTDLAWSSVTQWRALLASAIEHPRFGPIDDAIVSGPASDASAELLAGWLSATLGVPVTRKVGTEGIELRGDGDSVAITRLTDHIAVLSRPGEKDSQVALGRRAIWDCLAEEMRRLDPDEIYENALAGLPEVLYEGTEGASTGERAHKMTQTQLLRFPDQTALVADAAPRLIAAIADAQTQRGVARIVLTGGGAGIALLAALRESADAVDWRRIEFYWGDERFLPPSDPERNEVQARKALLDHVPVDHMSVHPMPTDSGQFAGDVDAAADFYRQHLPEGDDGEALFDIHLLGMGGEGHVNSIFPDSPAVHEAAATVVAVRNCPKPPPTRITMTLPLVRRSAQVWLLVAGAEKAEAAAAAIHGASPVDIPSAGAIGMEHTLWFLDEAAAAGV